MSSDEQFTAHGPAIIGFQTHPLEPIERGVDVRGDQLGVRGGSTLGPGVMGDSRDEFGVEGKSEKSAGVFGKGAIGVEGRGTRGPGVKGAGEIGLFFAEPGVIGHGARRPDGDNSSRLPHGPGVMGVGGGVKNIAPMKAQFGSAGVFGFGADMTVTTATDGRVHGPGAPGVGVMGAGGSGKPHDGPLVRAPGVVGFSGSAAGGVLMSFESGRLGDVGVFGRGAIGVEGSGTRGPGAVGRGPSAVSGRVGAANLLWPGVVGFGGARQEHGGRESVESAAGVVGVATGMGAPTPHGDGAGVYGIGVMGLKGVGVGGRGGVFQSSEKAAQLGLTPVRGPRFPQVAAHAPEVVDDPPAQGLKLPADGLGGDLMVVQEGRGRCRLWFCIQGAGGRGALWAEVLLGPSFLGVG